MDVYIDNIVINRSISWDFPLCFTTFNDSLWIGMCCGKIYRKHKNKLIEYPNNHVEVICFKVYNGILYSGGKDKNRDGNILMWNEKGECIKEIITNNNNRFGSYKGTKFIEVFNNKIYCSFQMYGMINIYSLNGDFIHSIYADKDDKNIGNTNIQLMKLCNDKLFIGRFQYTLSYLDENHDFHNFWNNDEIWDVYDITFYQNKYYIAGREILIVDTNKTLVHTLKHRCNIKIHNNLIYTRIDNDVYIYDASYKLVKIIDHNIHHKEDHFYVTPFIHKDLIIISYYYHNSMYVYGEYYPHQYPTLPPSQKNKLKTWRRYHWFIQKDLKFLFERELLL